MMRTWIWQHFSIDVPTDWEMLQFSRNPSVGRCAFADRYQFRLEFNWKIIPGEPDFKRMIGDYRERLEESLDVVSTEEKKHGQWWGIDSIGDEVLHSRFGRFFEEKSCLIEIVFLWTEGKDRSLTKKVLDSVQAQPVVNDQYSHWKAFGMDVLASKDLEMAQCQVETALAKILFSDKRKERIEIFQRLGMVPEWLNVPTEQWLARQMDDLTEVRTSFDSVNGHDIVTKIGKIKKKRWPMPGSKMIEQVSSAWVCPHDGRLLCATVLSAKEPNLAGTRLGCCEGILLNR